jgi:hypothetical protein
MKEAKFFTYGREYKAMVEVESEEDLKKLADLLKSQGFNIVWRSYTG